MTLCVLWPAFNLPIHEEKTYRVTKTQEQSSPVEEVWAASHALGEKDSAYVYLRSRGLKKCFPAALRASNRLRYAQLSEDGRSWDHSFYEGLVAEIVNSEGHRVSLHRTYLDKGRKAPLRRLRKYSARSSGARFVWPKRTNPACSD